MGRWLRGALAAAAVLGPAPTAASVTLKVRPAHSECVYEFAATGEQLSFEVFSQSNFELGAQGVTVRVAPARHAFWDATDNETEADAARGGAELVFRPTGDSEVHSFTPDKTGATCVQETTVRERRRRGGAPRARSLSRARMVKGYCWGARKARNL